MKYKFEDLEVWNISLELSDAIYKLKKCCHQLKEENIV